MSRMCIISILFSISNTCLILFLSIPTYIHNCIVARMHFRCHDVTKREFRRHKRRSLPIPLTDPMNKANIGVGQKVHPASRLGGGAAALCPRFRRLCYALYAVGCCSFNLLCIWERKPQHVGPILCDKVVLRACKASTLAQKFGHLFRISGADDSFSSLEATTLENFTFTHVSWTTISHATLIAWICVRYTKLAYSFTDTLTNLLLKLTFLLSHLLKKSQAG